MHDAPRLFEREAFDVKDGEPVAFRVLAERVRRERTARPMPLETSSRIASLLASDRRTLRWTPLASMCSSMMWRDPEPTSRSRKDSSAKV